MQLSSLCLNLFSAAYQPSNFRKSIHLVMYLNFFVYIIGIIVPISQNCLGMETFNICKAPETVTGTCAFCTSVCFYFLLKRYILKFMKNAIIIKYTMFHVLIGKNSPHIIPVLCLWTLKSKSKCYSKKEFYSFLSYVCLKYLFFFF